MDQANMFAVRTFSDDEREELQAAALELASGRHGSFAAHIGDAMLVADDANLERLRRAFPHLVQKAWDFVLARS